MLVNPAKSQMVEMLVDSGSARQHFGIEADSSDLVHGTLFTGSPDNQVFAAYQAYAADQYAKRIKPLQTIPGQRKDTRRFGCAYRTDPAPQ